MRTHTCVDDALSKIVLNLDHGGRVSRRAKLASILSEKSNQIKTNQIKSNQIPGGHTLEAARRHLLTASLSAFFYRATVIAKSGQ